MQIVGVTGIIGSGKTTFADFLAERAPTSQHYESWLIIAEVANGLRASGIATPAPNDITGLQSWLQPLSDLIYKTTMQTIEFRLTAHDIQQTPELYQKLFGYLEGVQSGIIEPIAPITESNKKSCRSLLQWLGGYFVATHKPTIWYDEIMRRINQHRAVDLVTIGGVRYPTDAQAIIGAGGSIVKIERPTLAAQDATDLTERQRSLIVPNVTVQNNGSLDDLRSLAEQFYSDLQVGTMQPIYSH